MGRPRHPRLSIEETRYALTMLLPTEDIMFSFDSAAPRHGALQRLANRLGISGEAVRQVYRDGGTTARIADWTRRMQIPTEKTE